ncbi:ribonuclease D [Pseudomonadota bacterium]
MSKITIKKAIESAEHPILLETVTQLEQAEQSWNKSTILGIDTEFVRERTYRADLGLVQVSDGQTAWLFDPLKFQTYDPLARLMENPGILKLLHSGSEDLEVLLNAVGAAPEPLVDTQIACAMLGQSLQLGYHHALKWLFDVEIDKDQTRSNWLKRPLTRHQLRYAAMDVVLLPEMYKTLRDQLDESGRWSWLEEDVARMQRNARNSIDPEIVYQRFAGIGRMDDQTLQVLKYLARWREEVAIARNRARGFVIPDATLLQMSRSKPTTKAGLQDVEGIHPVVMSRYADTLLSLVEEALADDTPVEKFAQLDEEQRAQLKQMRGVVTERSAKLGVDPALLASRRELEKLIRALEADAPIPERFLGWRKAVVTDELIGIASQ